MICTKNGKGKLLVFDGTQCEEEKKGMTEKGDRKESLLTIERLVFFY